VAPPKHGEMPADVDAAKRAAEAARARGAFIVNFGGLDTPLPDSYAKPLLDSVAHARHEGPPNGADSAALREALPKIFAKLFGGPPSSGGPPPGPTQCHDITVYPA